LIRLALGVGVLVAMTLALTGCGSGLSQEEEAKARPLPKQPQELRPGEYRSEEFKPSFSFRVGKGWSTSEYASDYLGMGWAEKEGRLAFVNVQKVYKPIYKPTQTSTPKLE
jgi:hypothetical protein